jgi:hypothetical protein
MNWPKGRVVADKRPHHAPLIEDAAIYYRKDS